MKQSTKYLFHTLVLASLFLALNLLSSCGTDSHKEAVIENSPGGLELLEREFGECDDGTVDDNVPEYLRSASHFERRSQNDLPHSYPSLGEMYPSRGSFRQTREEIEDIVDRYIWSSERGTQKLLNYFDMVLWINVAPRDSNTPAESSAQRMQVYLRNGSSSDQYEDWDRTQVWPISSGIPCGQKIATFTGVYKFNPGRVYRSYYSELFKDANMYETMFLYHSYQNGNPTGVAIHGTYATTTLGRRDSGGCIRLHRDNAQCLYTSIKGSDSCMDGQGIGYEGRVPSFMSRWGEADPEYLSDGRSLEVNGIKVLIAIFNDSEDRL